MTSKYRILKLKSGEEIIARIVGQKKEKMILERPMIFKSIVVESGFSGKREITVLKNWLHNSNQIRTEIPKDHIATFLEPHKLVEDLYEYEKDKEDVNGDTKKILSPEESRKEIPPPPPFGEIDADLMKKHMESLLDAMQENENMEIEMEENEMKPPSDMDEVDMEFVIMNFMFPPKIIKDMIDRGMLNFDDLKNITNSDDNIQRIKPEEISNEYTGDDIGRDDYGNLWSDWSNDINDYLED